MTTKTAFVSRCFKSESSVPGCLLSHLHIASKFDVNAGNFFKFRKSAEVCSSAVLLYTVDWTR